MTDISSHDHDQQVAIVDPRPQHRVTFRTHEERRRLVGDRKVIQVQPFFDMISAGERKPARAKDSI